MTHLPKFGKVFVAIALGAVTTLTGCRSLESSAKPVKVEDLTLASTATTASESAQPLDTLTGHSNYVQAIAISTDGQILASGGDDGAIKLWNLPKGIRIRTLEGHSDWVNSEIGRASCRERV